MVSKSEHEIHVMFDQQNRDVLRQVRDGSQNVVPLAFKDTRGGFVRQKIARLCRHRERNLQQPLSP